MDYMGQAMPPIYVDEKWNIPEGGCVTPVDEKWNIPEGGCVTPDVMPMPGFYWACVDGKAKQVRKADREKKWIPPGQGNYPMPWLHKQVETQPVEPAVSGSGPLPALIAGGIALWALTQ